MIEREPTALAFLSRSKRANYLANDPRITRTNQWMALLLARLGYCNAAFTPSFLLFLSYGHPLLSPVTLRDTHTTLSLPLFRFPSLSLSFSRTKEREQKHLPSLVDLALPFYAIRHLHPSFISLRFLSSNVTSRTINFRPAPTRPSSPPPFSRPFDWSRLFTTKGWSINPRLSTHPFGVASWFPSIFPVEFSSRPTCPFTCGRTLVEEEGRGSKWEFSCCNSMGIDSFVRGGIGGNAVFVASDYC